MDMNEAVTTQKTIGRNESCPCGSGKKYKRCCGVGAAPKVTPPKQNFDNPDLEGGENPFDPSVFQNFNPEMMMQATQSLQRLPKGQLQRLQAIMQKAMRGKDVSTEAQEFQKSLPLELQTLMQSLSMMSGMAKGGGNPENQVPALSAESASLEGGDVESSPPPMTEEEARALVAKAAAEGKIGQEEADALLKKDEASESLKSESLENNTAENDTTENDAESKLSRFWKNFKR